MNTGSKVHRCVAKKTLVTNRMSPENNLEKLVKGMTPKLNEGEYVFAVIDDLKSIDINDAICMFKEAEGITVVIERNRADKIGLSYQFISNWISLMIHSSLNSIGLTAVFSSELAKNNISCNVIAGVYHDHIFVAIKDSKLAMEVLDNLSKSY